MRKNTLTLILGICALCGWVVYLFIAERQPPSFEVQQEVAQDKHLWGQPADAHSNDGTEHLEQKLVDELTASHELEPAAAKLAQQTTSADSSRGVYDRKLLQQLYDQDPSQTTASLLLLYEAKEFHFDNARSLIQQYPGLLPTHMSYADATKLYTNTGLLIPRQSRSIQGLKVLLDTRKNSRYLTADDSARYNALIVLREGRYDQLMESLDMVDSRGAYSSIVQAMRQHASYVQGQQDVPSYYLHALWALTLLQHQYLTFAEQIALDVISQDPNYILPYQILAYSTFLQGQRDESSAYIRDLMARDTQQRPIYQFMLGVMAYRREDYQEAVLYLVGIDDVSLLADAQRYLALSYRELGDIEQVAQQYQLLMQRTDLSASDFYDVFYRVYFFPYRTNTAYTLLDAHPEIVMRYQQQCRVILDQEDHRICDYGEVGQLWASKQHDQAFKKLLYLTKYYPQSYFFEALGDYYQLQDKKEQAIMYYLQAMRYTKDGIERIDATAKIKKILGR